MISYKERKLRSQAFDFAQDVSLRMGQGSNAFYVQFKIVFACVLKVTLPRKYYMFKNIDSYHEIFL